MKILHCIFDFSFIDDWGYQENILSEMHKYLGHDVCILTSTISECLGMKTAIYKSGSYYLKNGVRIIRVTPYKIPTIINKKIRLLHDVYKEISKFSPDIIFLHNGGTSASVYYVIYYLKKHPNVKLIVDSHADYINSARNCLSETLLHKGIYRHFYKKLIPYTNIFFGTLPTRCDFMENVYCVPKEKIKLLLMGINDINIPYDKKEMIRLEIRDKYDIREEDFVLITGGKIDKQKNIIELMKAVMQVSQKNIKLIIFGEPVVEMQKEFKKICNSERIKVVGWIDSKEVYRYFFAADLAFFPGTHSVLWEQAVACGLPGVFRHWDGINHVDLGGNCIFIEDCSVNGMRDIIEELYKKPIVVGEMKKNALEKGRKEFSYLEIAKKSLQDCI